MRFLIFRNQQLPFFRENRKIIEPPAFIVFIDNLRGCILSRCPRHQLTTQSPPSRYPSSCLYAPITFEMECATLGFSAITRYFMYPPAGFKSRDSPNQTIPAPLDYTGFLLFFGFCVLLIPRSLSAELHIPDFLSILPAHSASAYRCRNRRMRLTAHTQNKYDCQNLGQLSIVLFRLFDSTSGSGSGLVSGNTTGSSSSLPLRSSSVRNSCKSYSSSLRAYTHSRCSLPGRSPEKRCCRPWSDREELFTGIVRDVIFHLAVARNGETESSLPRWVPLPQ